VKQWNGKAKRYRAGFRGSAYFFGELLKVFLDLACFYSKRLTSLL